MNTPPKKEKKQNLNSEFCRKEPRFGIVKRSSLAEAPFSGLVKKRCEFGSTFSEAILNEDIRGSGGESFLKQLIDGYSSDKVPYLFWN
ncbi:unnamed protein product [Microthlaspi erraticum]|uniref:Uncharacterized protein n=1 Tax=Microthlaspi erraticum TaxID=1685480 RepID=A0A6D2KP85_9BRAS|nr:unnamed protein product [Microthlaspi erraticum]